MSDTGECPKCGAPLIIALSEKGRQMRLDAAPTGPWRGLFTLDLTSGDHTPTAVPVPEKGPMHTSHDATCPRARQ